MKTQNVVRGNEVTDRIARDALYGWRGKSRKIEEKSKLGDFVCGKYVP
jgi:hypothetical protein